MSAPALLAAVVATPDDDLVRLVFADWYEENGDPDRGELIRVQCELAKLPDWDGRCLALKHRERVLLARHGRRWAAELPAVEGVRWGAFHRGFVRNATVDDVKTLTKHGPAMGTLAPLDGVTLSAWPARKVTAKPLPWLKRMGFNQRDEFQPAALERLLDSALAEHLTALDFTYIGVENAGAEVVARQTHLRGLRSLDFSNCFVGVAGARALSEAKHLSSLTRLEFGSYGSGYVEDPFVREEAVERIAASPHLRNLTHLGLGGNGVTTRGIQALLASRTLANLTSVNLSQSDQLDPAAFALTDGPARWTELNLSSWWRVTADPLAVLTLNPQLHRLVRLKLSQTAVTATGVRALAASPAAGSLRVLALNNSSVGLESAEALAAGRWPHLHTLTLANNQLRPAGVTALAESEGFPALAVLDLKDCSAGDAGAKAVAAAAWAPTLRRLDLSGNTYAYYRPNPQGDEADRTFGPSGAKALAGSKALRGLTELKLAGQKLGADGARAVAAGDFPHLTDFDLSSVEGGDRVAEALAESGKLNTLLALHLSNTKLTAAGLAKLTAEPAPTLGMLTMSSNDLGDAGGHALAAADWPALRSLHMMQCGVKADGMAALATSPLFDRLSQLNHYGNTVPTTGPAAAKFNRNDIYRVLQDPTWLPVEEGDGSEDY